MKKLLILAGASVHVKIVNAAKEMGIYTVVADYLPPEKSPAKKLADEHLEMDIADVDGLVDFCRRNRIDGVIDFCIDPAQRPAQAIAEKVGLPTFGSAGQVFALTNKTEFKKFCEASGVLTIPSYTEDDVKNGRVSYPLLVKPIDSRGSRGVAVCWSKEEVVDAIGAARRESSDGGCIIEKYMAPESCQDLTISYLVKDGVPTLVSLGDRHSGRREDNLDRQLICTIQPSRFLSMYLKNVDPLIKGMIRRLGIKNGPVFFQGFQDGDTVRLYDPGMRFPGNEYEQILNHATGINLMKSLIGYCVGGEIDDFGGRIEGCYDLSGKVCLQYMVNVRKGVIGSVLGLDEIAQHPNVVDVTQKHFAGDVIEATGDVLHRAGEISVLCDRSVSNMTSMIDFIHSKLRILDEEGKNQLISEFQSEFVKKTYKGVW